MIRLVGIAGSLRSGSHSASVLRVAANLLPPGVRLEEFVDLRDVPPYDEDLDGLTPPGTVGALRRLVADADGLVVVTPEYNGSVPGVLKNAIDWLSRPFPGNALRDLPVSVMGVTTGLFGAVWAQADLRRILSIAGAAPLDVEVPLARVDTLLGPLGELEDADARMLVESSLGLLVARIGRSPRGRATTPAGETPQAA